MAQGVRRVGESLVSMQQGEAALEAIQSSTRQLDDDVKDFARRKNFKKMEHGLRILLDSWIDSLCWDPLSLENAPVRPHEKKNIKS